MSDTPQMVRIFLGVLVLGLIFSLGFRQGLRLSPAENSPVVDPGQVLAERFSQPLEAPGDLQFLFFTDSNQNGVFDQNEAPFQNVSVELRRQGQEAPFQSVPADNRGRVVISGLPEGNYEVRYSYADLTGYTLGDFNIRSWYQIISPTGATRRLPSEWESLPQPKADQLMAGAAEEIKLGIVEYVPDKVLVGQTKNQLFFVDPTTNQVYGESNLFADNLWHRFDLIGDKVYFVKDNELKLFDLKNRVSQSVIKPIYGLDNWSYRLSPATDTVVYAQNGELSYQTRDYWCGQGSVVDNEGYRLLVNDLMIGWRDGQQFTAYAFTRNDPDFKVYLIGCRDGRFEAFATDWPVSDIKPLTNPSGGTYGSTALDIIWGEVDL